MRTFLPWLFYLILYFVIIQSDNFVTVLFTVMSFSGGRIVVSTINRRNQHAWKFYGVNILPKSTEREKPK